MEKRSNLHLREVFDAVFKKDRCQYLVVDKDMNITSYSENTAIYYDLSNLENNTNLFSVMEELVGYEEEVKSLLLDDSKTLEILFVAKKNDRFINISLQKGTNDVLVILLEDVSKYAAFYQSSVHDRNEKELLLLKTEKQNTKLLQVSKNMEILANNEIEKNKEKELILMQQSKMASMGDMIANIAHQWKQPLNALSAITGVIILKYQLGSLDEKQVDKFANDSSLLISQMTNTIDDFTNFFKPNKKKKLFNITDSIKRVNNLVASTLNLLSIELNFNKDVKYMLCSYQNELEQVLINIIQNAKDILVERDISTPIINIEVSQTDDWYSIDISDNAGGVPDDIINKIFDPYFSTKEEHKGTGIGLHMSKLIVESNMQGVLSIHNTDEGACFSIKLENTNNV